MKEKSTYKILQQLVDHTLPKSYRPIVRAWLITDEDREAKEEALYKVWTESNLSESEYSLEEPLAKTWEKIKTSERTLSRRLFLRKISRYAAVILLPLITGITVWLMSGNQKYDPTMVEYFVPNGDKQTVILPDGSTIQVNAGSLLVYPSRFSKKQRQVYLSGEANFSVVSNPKSPFIVRTGGLNIEVLGTKFNVESYPGSSYIATTLEHGAVKVYKEGNPKAAILMSPNEQLVYFPYENRFTTSQVDVADYSAWIHGELRFVNKSIDEILFTMEHRYNVRFLIDPRINRVDLYTMKFKAHETIEDALYVLGEILGNISYQRKGQTISLSLKSKEVTR